MVIQKLKSVAALALSLFAMAGSAKTTSLEIPASGGAWSQLEWSNGVPADGDTVYLNNGNAADVTLENDTASTLAAIFVGGTAGVTLSGLDLALTGDTAYSVKISNVNRYYALSNEVPFTVDVPLTVADSSLWHFRNHLTFNHDVSVADDKTLSIYRNNKETGDGAAAICYNLTFGGHFYASNATLAVGVYKGNKIAFNKSMHVMSHIGIDQYPRAMYCFYAPGNTWKGMEVGANGTCKNYYAADAHDPTQPMWFGAVIADQSTGIHLLYADQTVNGLVSEATTINNEAYGAQIQSDNDSTLFIRPSASCSARCSFGERYNLFCRLNVDFAAVGDNADNVVQTLSGRAYQRMVGSFVVRAGTLRTEGTTRFLVLPVLTLLGGVYESACSNAAGSPEFPELDKLYIASTARFRIDAASVASPFAAGRTMLVVDAGGKIEVPSEMSVSFKTVIAGGAAVESGTYTKSNATWVDGDGEVVVASPADWNYWKSATGGKWTDAANWSKGTVPSSSETAVLIGAANDFTVSTEGLETLPKGIRIYGFGGKKATLATDTVMSLVGCDIFVSDGGVLSVPATSSVYMDSTTGLTVEKGGEVSVVGAVSGKQLKASYAGKLSVSGSFAVTNTTDNLFVVNDGAEINVKDGLFRVVGSNYNTVSFATKTRNVKMVATGTGVIDMFRNDNHTTFNYYGREVTLSNSVTMSTGGQQISNPIADTTNSFNLLDQALLSIGATAQIRLGYEGVSASSVCEMNLASEKPLLPGYGLYVGRKASAVLNLRNGQELYFNGYGTLVPEGAAANQRNKTGGLGQGVINVWDGSISCESLSQSARALVGYRIGVWHDVKCTEQTERLHGELNVFKDGEVNVKDGSGNRRVHFIVGCGLFAEGEVNVHGGKILNRSEYNPLVGQWAGKGAVNVFDGGLVFMRNTMFVGGSSTDDLVSFVNNHNKAADCAEYYPLNDKTGEGVINVENGTFVEAADAVFSAAGTGALSVGADGLFVAKNVCLSNSVVSATETNVSTLTVTCGATGCGSVVCGTADETGTLSAIDGTLKVAPGSKLVVDARSMTAPSKTYLPLVQFSAIEGEFAESDIRLRKPAKGGKAWRVIRTVRDGVDGYYLHAQAGLMIIFK